MCRPGSEDLIGMKKWKKELDSEWKTAIAKKILPTQFLFLLPILDKAPLTYASPEANKQINSWMADRFIFTINSFINMKSPA